MRPDRRYRFLLIQPYFLPEHSKLQMRPAGGPKEVELMNYREVASLLANVEWELHPGPLAPHGDGGWRCVANLRWSEQRGCRS